MSARYGIGRVANSNEFGKLQRKVENLYDGYNVSITFIFLNFLGVSLILKTLKFNFNHLKENFFFNENLGMSFIKTK